MEPAVVYGRTQQITRSRGVRPYTTLQQNVAIGPILGNFDVIHRTQEVGLHNVLQRHQTKPFSDHAQWTTCTENLLTCVVLEICSRTDRQTDRQTCSSQYFTATLGAKL